MSVTYNISIEKNKLYSFDELMPTANSGLIITDTITGSGVHNRKMAIASTKSDVISIFKENISSHGKDSLTLLMKESEKHSFSVLFVHEEFRYVVIATCITEDIVDELDKLVPNK